MKKIISLTAILACFTVFVNAQTSMTDYQYVTKEFKDEIYKGLGFRLGYSLEKVGSKVEIVNGRNTKAAHLFALVINGITKAYMVKFWDSESNRAYYCIPTADADLSIKAMALKDIAKADKDTRELIERLRSIF